MRFDIVTLFPELFAPFLSVGVTRRAYESKQLDVRLWQLRDWAEGNYKRVDDRPFGGGPGMLMQAEPLARCVQAVRQERADAAPVLLFAPQGQVLQHKLVSEWAQHPLGAILICGRYEGIDQRFIDSTVDLQISIGDYVLSGGELAAMVFLDSIARLQEGVLHSPASHEQESFHPAQEGMLDHPHYTRPESWRGLSVPLVLLQGNHAQIDAWRRDQRLALTQKYRPELLLPSTPVQTAVRVNKNGKRNPARNRADDAADNAADNAVQLKK